MLRMMNWANLVTMLGLTASICCAWLAIAKNFPAAIIALMISGMCDLFDGFISARAEAF